MFSGHAHQLAFAAVAATAAADAEGDCRRRPSCTTRRSACWARRRCYRQTPAGSLAGALPEGLFPAPLRLPFGSLPHSRSRTADSSITCGGEAARGRSRQPVRSPPGRPPPGSDTAGWPESGSATSSDRRTSPAGPASRQPASATVGPLRQTKGRVLNRAGVSGGIAVLLLVLPGRPCRGPALRLEPFKQRPHPFQPLHHKLLNAGLQFPVRQPATPSAAGLWIAAPHGGNTAERIIR